MTRDVKRYITLASFETIPIIKCHPSIWPRS